MLLAAVVLQHGEKKVKKSYPLVICYSLLLRMAIEIVSFPMKHGDLQYLD